MPPSCVLSVLAAAIHRVHRYNNNNNNDNIIIIVYIIIRITPFRGFLSSCRSGLEQQGLQPHTFIARGHEDTHKILVHHALVMLCHHLS